MVLIRCPQCAMVIEDVPGVVPVCPRCGFGSPPGTAPPTAPPQGGQPPQGAPLAPPPWPPQAVVPEAMRPTSPKAVTALVTGIASLVPYLGFIIGIVAVVFGILARNETGPMGRFKGRGMATAGLVMGIVGILLTVLLPVIIFVLVSNLGE